MAQLESHKQSLLNVLTKVFPHGNATRMYEIAKSLPDLAAKHGIVNNRQLAHFLAQIGAESQFKYVKELGDYDYFINENDYHKKNGNRSKAEAYRLIGRGFIQITGYTNYLKCSQALFGDDRLIKHPEILEQPKYALLSALFYWKWKNISQYCKADNVKVPYKIYYKKSGKWHSYIKNIYPIEAVTRKINGWLNHLRERKSYYLSLQREFARLPDVLKKKLIKPQDLISYFLSFFSSVWV